MTPNDNTESMCPYCNTPNPELTDDHIFPQFLGGRRIVKICRECNSRFGQTFEASTSRQLKCLQVFISHFGLDMTRNSATWPSALVIDNITYDLTSGPDGAQYVLSKPVVNRDSMGKITGGKARSISEAQTIAKGLIKSGHAKEVEITQDAGAPFQDMILTASFSFNPNLYRFATKLVAAVLIRFGKARLVSNSQIPAYLHGKDVHLATLAYCDIGPIIKLRPPLAHTIYVELGDVSYGVVLLFGFQKLFVPLPFAPKNEAFLATLDPMTGDENFQNVEPIGPRTVPSYIREPDVRRHIHEMNTILTQDAILRGAKHPPNLETKELDLGPPATFVVDGPSSINFGSPAPRESKK